LSLWQRFMTNGLAVGMQKTAFGDMMMAQSWHTFYISF
jgi:hypothetical protein